MAQNIPENLSINLQSPSVKKRILRVSEGEGQDKSYRRSLDLKVHISQDIKYIPSPPPHPHGSPVSCPSFEYQNFSDVDEIDGNAKPNLEASNSNRFDKEEKGKFSYHQDSMKKYKRMLSRNKEEQERKISKVEEGVEEKET
eukprot:GFUD01097938.1.p1 GENE.GFUD01097938.1~~GFUD01097938.1.p1  ORF type:complete len:162 (-),score=45.14 GFUD01097938.1:112-537(-)